MSHEHAQTGRWRRWAPGLALGLFVVIVAGVVAASGRGGPSEASDELKYHLPIIDEMVREWPAIDVVNYASATSPGYHALMAGVRVALGEQAGPVGMRALNVAFGALVPIACYLIASLFTTRVRAVLVSAPLAVNSYVLGGAIYLTTDNLAYLCVFVTLGACLRPLCAPRAALGGVGCVFAVLVRQIHVRSIAPLGAAALLASPLALRSPAAMRDKQLSWRTALVGWVGGAVAVGILVVFVIAWGGLTPPADTAAKHAAGLNPASAALALSLCGVFIPLLGGRELIRTVRDDGLRWVVVGACAGLIAGVAFPTSFELKHRAYGWMWRIVEHAPDVRERSVAFVILAVIGGGALCGLVRAAAARGRSRELVILGISVLAWFAAQSVNTMAWQRYYEPMILALTAWLAALAWAGAPRSARERTLAYGGPAVLVLLQLCVSALTIGREILRADPVNF